MDVIEQFTPYTPLKGSSSAVRTNVSFDTGDFVAYFLMIATMSIPIYELHPVAVLFGVSHGGPFSSLAEYFCACIPTTILFIGLWLADGRVRTKIQ